MLYGIDVSHHNSDNIIEETMIQMDGDFIIHKLTEGATWVDSCVKRRALKFKNMLHGFYHYARPENNTVQKEVDNFIKNLPIVSVRTLYILDWEGNALLYNIDWAISWCEKVHDIVGRWPIIYASASVIRKYADRYKYWWTAHYNQDCETGCEHDGGVDEVMTQYRNSPIDTDTFHGTYEDWINLGRDIAKDPDSVYQDTDSIVKGPEPVSQVMFEWFDDKYRYKVIREKING